MPIFWVIALASAARIFIASLQSEPEESVRAVRGDCRFREYWDTGVAGVVCALMRRGRETQLTIELEALHRQVNRLILGDLNTASLQIAIDCGKSQMFTKNSCLSIRIYLRRRV